MKQAPHNTKVESQHTVLNMQTVPNNHFTPMPQVAMHTRHLRVGITIKSVNITLFWSKPSHMRISIKTATHFSLQWRTVRITTIRGASLGISMGVFTGVWLYLKMLCII